MTFYLVRECSPGVPSYVDEIVNGAGATHRFTPGPMAATVWARQTAVFAWLRCVVPVDITSPNIGCQGGCRRYFRFLDTCL